MMSQDWRWGFRLTAVIGSPHSQSKDSIEQIVDSTEADLGTLNTSAPIQVSLVRGESNGQIVTKKETLMSTALRNIPAREGVRMVEPGEGERFDVVGAHLTWKVKGEDSDYAFSVCEQTLDPGEGVPLHSHSSPEVFYVLAGRADFFRIVDGRQDWIHCENGSTVILPPNSLHAFYNRSSEPCRVLGISTQLHQAFFDAVARSDQEDPFSALSLPDAMARVAQIGRQHNMYFAPYDVTIGAE
jgi:quercetin dioxygenase-like cupin family protein